MALSESDRGLDLPPKLARMLPKNKSLQRPFQQA
jgi:hypothetical protein